LFCESNQSINSKEPVQKNDLFTNWTYPVNSLTQLSVNNDLNFSLFPSQNDCRALEDLSFCAP